MKRYLIILLICLLPLLAFAAVDTFDGQTGIDTWDGQIGVDTIDGQVISSGEASCSGNYGDVDEPTSNYDAAVAGSCYVCKVTLDCSASSAELYNWLRYVNTSDREMYFLVYSDSAGEPNTKLAETGPWLDAGTSVTAWTHQTVTTNFSSGDYWIGGQYESTTTRLYYSGTSGTCKSLAGSFGSAPATWDTGSDTDTNHEYGYYLGF